MGVSISIDVMSGDRGIDVTVPAAIEVLKRHEDTSFILVGDASRIEERIKPKAYPEDRLRCVHAPQKVEMDEQPTHALRTKRESSMWIAISLVRQGDAAACVSAGNTGALMAISRYVLRMLAGIERPAIIAALPSSSEHTYMLDLGANIDCKADHLFQFAMMGAVLVAALDNIPRPRIGLLNIGQEAIKGNDQIREADRRLRESSLNYIGYIEANQIYHGVADVVVSDGFSGNVSLKSSEGVAEFIVKTLNEAFSRNRLTQLSGLFAMPVLKLVRKLVDPRRYNGASLLGLQGVVIKSHGGADAVAFEHALETARLEALKQVPQLIDKQLEAFLM